MDSVNKILAMENNKCVEKYPSKSDFYYYYFCSEYKGTNKKFCEAIRPYTPSTSTYTSSSTSRNYPVSADYSAKCVYGNYGCKKKRKNMRKQVLKLNADIFLQKIPIKCVFSNLINV